MIMLMPGLASAAGNAIVSVSAPADGIDTGEQFTINIAVEPNNAIAGMQFSLSFDPAVVTVNSITEGNLLKQGGANTYFNNGQINNATGTITGVFGAIISPGQTVATAGTFAVITMTAGSAEGSSPLTLSNVVIGDIASQPLPISLVNKTINITAAAPVSPPPPGGNDIGGESSGAAGVTSLRGIINATGMLLEDVITADVNSRVELYIPAGAIVRNKYGQALISLSIRPQEENEAPGPGSAMIGQLYEINPEGATFDGPATLLFRYSLSEIPTGVPIQNLYIALWDPVTMTWTDLGGTLDSNAGTVSVPISHLSVYALMVHNRPANLTITNFQLTPGEVAPGETVTASIDVNNQGDLTGTYQASLILDDAAMQSRTVNLEGGASETVVFSIILNTPGVHRVSLGGMTATFVVKGQAAAAVFTINGLEIEPASVGSGEKVNISVLIENTGDLSGTYPVTLSIDGVIVATREIVLDGGGSLTASFSVSEDTIGEHSVNIAGLQGIFEVNQSAQPAGTDVSELELRGFSTTPNYDEITNTLISVRIEYQLNKALTSQPDATLMMTVYYNGELLEQVPLLTLSHLTADGETGEFDYVPGSGWMAGEYAFKAELYDDENLIQNTLSHNLVVTKEAITRVVSWWTLGAVIGIATIFTIVLTAVIIYRRRDMLRS